MLPKSIRWRLPLSYGTIALLATLALGVVLLTTLRGHYARQERDYLMGNAQEVAGRMARLLASEVPTEVLQAQVETFAFLSQTRVRLRDATGRVLADSGVPESIQVVSGVAESGERSAIYFTWGRAITPTVSAVSGGAQAVGGFVITDFAITDTIPPPEPPVLAPAEPMAVVGTLHGFDLGRTATVPAVTGPRSDQSVHTAFYDQTGSLLGTVELSDGPAYGREIVNSVARAWAIAGGVAVVLAAGVGWLVSRQMSGPLLALTGVTGQMAAGDLSARADVARQDEFGALARSFNRMADQVEETVVTLRRFVSDAAHEIHTPLTALRTNLELAPDDDFVKRGQVQVERLETLTKGLLDLSHIEAGAQAVARAPVALIPLVQEVSELYASRAEQIGLSFSLDVPEGAVTIRGNEAQLRRALGNLLDNAIKFTPEGGGVSVRLQQTEGWVELSVEDTGIGIPTDDLPQLFSHFHRGRNAVAYPGSGLGLAIVKAIVERHGGQVMVENTSQGARFSIQVPTAG